MIHEGKFSLKVPALKTFSLSPAYKYALFSAFILYISEGFPQFVTVSCRYYNVDKDVFSYSISNLKQVLSSLAESSSYACFKQEVLLEISKSPF